MSKNILDLIQAVEQLPDFPTNLANQTIYNDDKSVKTYGPHDPHRVEQEQVIVAAARAEIIYKAVADGKRTDAELTKLVRDMLYQPTAGETGKNDDNAVSKRLEYLSKAVGFGADDEIKKIFKDENATISKSTLKVFFEGGKFPARSKDMAEIYAGEYAYEKDGQYEVVDLPKELMKKGYQLDEKNGTLHSISNERQYVKGQTLPDLQQNLQSVSTELDKKSDFYDTYFKQLAINGAFKGKSEINIIDIGVEHGELTSRMAEIALKYFPDKKINLVAVERSDNFLDKANEKLAAIDNENFSYKSVVHHFGDGVNEEIKAAGKADLILVTDVTNFNPKKFIEEAKEYAADNALIFMKHANAKDPLQQIKEPLKPYIRYLADKASEIDSALEGSEHRKGEMKAVIKDVQQFTNEDMEKIMSVKKADFMAKTFEEGSKELKAQRLLEFASGVPLAAFQPEVRKIAMEAFNRTFEDGISQSQATAHIFPAHEKLISQDVLEANYNAFDSAIKAVELNQDKHQPGGWKRYL